VDELFALESKFYRFCEIGFRMIVLNIFFLIASFPIITVPAAISAVIAANESPETKIYTFFWLHFRKVLLKTLPIGVFNIFSFYFGLASLRGALFSNFLFLKFLTIIVVLFLLSYNINLYILQVRGEQKLFYLFRDGFIFTIMYFHKTIIVMILSTIFYYLTFTAYPLLFNLFCLSGPLYYYQKMVSQ
jgi:uncharacterized membrane protein YesL